MATIASAAATIAATLLARSSNLNNAVRLADAIVKLPNRGRASMAALHDTILAPQRSTTKNDRSSPIQWKEYSVQVRLTGERPGRISR
jgi:hypothetical protein